MPQIGQDNEGRTIHVEPEHLERHMYLPGLTGTGKSTFMVNLAQNMVIGKWGGLALFDPHGYTAMALLDALPRSVVDQVVLIDPVNQMNHPIGMNVFDIPDRNRIDTACDWAVSSLKKALASEASPWVMTAERVARHLFRALAPQGGTLLEVERFLTDRAFRSKFYPYLVKHRDEGGFGVTYGFWHDQYDAKSRLRDPRPSKEQLEEAGPILRRIDRYTADTRARLILGQSRVGINLTEIMEEGKILIVRLPEGELGEGLASLIGSTILARLYIATLNRAEHDPKQRKPFYVLVDEFQKFAANEDLQRFFAEARKFGVRMVVAHQYRSQLTDRRLQDAVLGAGAIAAFQMLDKDAVEIGRQIGSKAGAYLPTLDRFQCYVKLPGEDAHLMKALPDLPLRDLETRRLIEVNSAQLGVPRQQVETEILARQQKRYAIKEEVKELDATSEQRGSDVETRQSPI